MFHRVIKNKCRTFLLRHGEKTFNGDRQDVQIVPVQALALVRLMIIAVSRMPKQFVWYASWS